MKRITVLVLLGMLSMLILPQAVFAADAGPCAENNAVNRFKGFGKVTAATVMAGAEAKLENQALNICTSASDDDRSNHLWVAVDANDNFGFDLVQAGLIHCKDPVNLNCNNYGTHEFWTWGRSHLASGCSGFSDVAPVNKYLGAFPSSSTTYTVVRTAQEWDVWVNGVEEQDVPLASICWTGRRALYTGESWDSGDAIGGLVDNKFRLWNALYEQNGGGVWSNTNWGTGAVCNLNSLARYKCNAPNGTSLDLWTVQP